MYKSRVTEDNPLLPGNESSPEIQAYGSSDKRSSAEITYSGFPAYLSDTDDKNSSPSASDTVTRAPIRSTAITTLTFVVFFALVFLAFRSDDTGIEQPPSIRPVPDNPPDGLNLDERVVKILRDTPLIDGHEDLAYVIRKYHLNAIYTEDFKNKFENGGLEEGIDLPRLRAGMVGGAFWSAWVNCTDYASEDFSDAEYGTAVSQTMQQIDLMKRIQRAYPKTFSPAGSSITDMLTRFHDTRMLFGPISIEGLHQIPQTAGMSTLRMYYDLGVRAATLTWNCHNAFADAAMNQIRGVTTPSGYHRGGLTSAGRALIREMNRLGMLVDISHTSYWTQKAVMTNNTSKAPVIFSHSSSWTLCPHPRNVRDDVLELVRKTNSVVQVNFAPDFISCVPTAGDMPAFYPPNNTLHQVARHITYIGGKIGYDHVGLGSDFDGTENKEPEGLEGVDKFPALVKELLRMGVSDSDASKIVGGNVLRVWRAAEKVAQEMQQSGELEGEDPIEA